MRTRRETAGLLAGTGLALAAPATARADTKAEIDAGVMAALQRLRGMQNVEPLLRVSVAQLIFPRLLRAGFIIGGQMGEGALVRNDAIDSYYQLHSVSFGLQAGAQTSGLAMIFMHEDAVETLKRNDGWEVGTGPSVVALTSGMQANLSSTTMMSPVYAVSFNQQGFMAALGLNGTKITPLNPPS